MKAVFEEDSTKQKVGEFGMGQLSPAPMLAGYPVMASVILARASARVLPCETQPGRAGHGRHEHSVLIWLYHDSVFHLPI